MFKHPLASSIAALVLALAGSTPASAADLPPLNDRMGVSTHFAHKTAWMAKTWDAEKLIPQAAELGVGWIRDEIQWRDIERSKGEYRVSERSRAWIRLANAHGLKIIVIFADNNPLYDDPWDPAAYARAAAWLAKELDGQIHAFEILNEPFGVESMTGGKGNANWTGRLSNGDESPWLARHLKLNNAAAAAIRKANPRIPIIGLGNTTSQNYRQIARGLSRAMTGITDHPYSFRSPPEIIPHVGNEKYIREVGFPVTDAQGTFASYIRMYREHLKKHDGPSQIWLTEFGWSTFREGDKNRTYLYSGFSEAAQARYLQRRLVEAYALDVTVNIVYDLLDDSGQTGGDFNAERFFGLIREDGSRKPAFDAVRNVALATRGFTPGNPVRVKVFPFSDRTEDRPNNWDGTALPALRRIMSYPFTDADGRAVYAVWSAERHSDLNVRAADIEFDVEPRRFEVEATDLMSGKTRRVRAADNAGRLTLEQFPVPDYPVLIRLLPAGSAR